MNLGQQCIFISIDLRRGMNICLTGGKIDVFLEQTFTLAGNFETKGFILNVFDVEVTNYQYELHTYIVVEVIE